MGEEKAITPDVVETPEFPYGGSIPKYADHEMYGEYADSTKRKEIKFMKPVHRTIARYLLAGYAGAYIARALNYSEAQITLIQHSPLFQAYYKDLEDQIESVVIDEARASLDEAAPFAAATLVNSLLNSPEEKIRVQCSFGILDRTGYPSKGGGGGEKDFTDVMRQLISARTGEAKDICAEITQVKIKTSSPVGQRG